MLFGRCFLFFVCFGVATLAYVNAASGPQRPFKKYSTVVHGTIRSSDELAQYHKRPRHFTMDVYSRPNYKGSVQHMRTSNGGELKISTQTGLDID